MEFEYDPQKSARNLAKHGIGFGEAQRLWDDERCIELASPFSSEDRYLVIGMIGNKHWTAIVTYRSAAVRIISVRRSRKKEAACYDEANRR